MSAFLKSWYMLTIMFTALSLAPAFAHLLEMPPKLMLDGAMWVTLLHNLYPLFGAIGGFFEVGSLLAAIVLVVLVRKRFPGISWALVGLLMLVANHALFWIWVAPVNAALGTVAPDALPDNWIELRNQWEYTHAIRALLQIVALATFVLSLLMEIPGKDAHRH